MAKTIPLTKGKEAIVSDSDYEWLSQHSWHAHSEGYAVGRLRGQGESKVFMHRAITEPLAGREVDHINGDRLDNRRENLRLVTRSQQNMNQSPRGGSSRFKGVSWFCHQDIWQAKIKIDGKQIHLGHYSIEEDAARAYNEAAREMFGEFALLNDLGDEA